MKLHKFQMHQTSDMIGYWTNMKSEKVLKFFFFFFCDFAAKISMMFHYVSMYIQFALYNKKCI